ncbi:MAG: glycosyltransferase family 2 protein [Lachnospiraceae bacterium]|nr:glycosyltransferase family 2 protein [Lachnospiraceae bacterium]
MKLLTIAVPCYNSSAYMHHCIDSLLVGGEDIEILIVDDGSTDETAAIADEYASRYPSVIRAIHKENGGHGSAVNTGIENASGFFFKVVDSDDYLRKPAFLETLEKLRELKDSPQELDMFLCNFVYNKESEHTKKVMQYRSCLPVGRIFTWDEIGHFNTGHYILMHSVIFRTGLLRECGMKLPEHCFYVDNIYVWQPLPFVKTMYYLDVNLYYYYIGRSDQSVNEQVMIRRLDQQMRVNRLMFDHFSDKKTVSMIGNRKKLKDYMYNYLKIITMISSVLPAVSGAKEDLEKRRELWHYMKEHDRCLYRKLRYGLTGIATNLHGAFGRTFVRNGYRLARHFYHFN